MHSKRGLGPGNSKTIDLVLKVLRGLINDPRGKFRPS